MTRAKVSAPINHKLGPNIHGWSLPAGPSCPGKSCLCAGLCYATRGHFVFNSIKQTHQRNWDFAQTEFFAPWLIGEIRQLGVRIFRIHVAGDFYDLAYVQKWRHIVHSCRHVTFFAYTRSWRVPEMLPDLLALGALPNMRLWWSIDRETGPAPYSPHIRTAYMAINDVDASTAPNDCDLVFRSKRNTPMKKANGVLVCPAENGVKGTLRHTCSTCRFCWDRKQGPQWAPVLLPYLTANEGGVAIDAPTETDEQYTLT